MLLRILRCLIWLGDEAAVKDSLLKMPFGNLICIILICGSICPWRFFFIQLSHFIKCLFLLLKWLLKVNWHCDTVDNSRSNQGWFYRFFWLNYLGIRLVVLLFCSTPFPLFHLLFPFCPSFNCCPPPISSNIWNNSWLQQCCHVSSTRPTEIGQHLDDCFDFNSW